MFPQSEILHIFKIDGEITKINYEVGKPPPDDVAYLKQSALSEVTVLS